MSARSLLSSVLGLAGLCALGGCSEAEVIAELRSLQGSEDAVFVCRDANGKGHPMSDCPDLDFEDDDDPSKRLSIYSLVSQTVTNEVAVVNVTSGNVVDTDPAVPGFGFLRVGARPVSLAATPGGAASFVATADVGQNGIFALATSCLDAPKKGEPQRDLTTWPACRLSSTPGKMAVIVESAACSSAASDAPADPPACHATLQPPTPGAEGGEGGPAGRRKLVVALPDEGQLAVLDAQWVLDRAPGTFPDCQIERLVPLAVDVPAGVTQTLPPDLQSTCSEVSAPMAPPPSQRAPRPAGFAVTEDRLYVADETAPVIHVLDTRSCGLAELPSLLPRSVREPWRVVTTRRVAASPLVSTASGLKRFVYAIDAEDQPGASVMAFDVSPGSTDPTPIVRGGSPELPGEKPDRLAIGSSAKDVAFAYRDLPYADPVTGVAEFGTLCDPLPSTPKDSPGGLARPSSDFLTGARPGLLRGLFGFVLLTNGAVAIVDVNDFDAPCRRPVQANPLSEPDFRGCANDPLPDGQSFTEDGSAQASRTVSGEVSCRVVEPHRFRGATLAINDPEVGVRAPALRGFPQLSLPPSAAGSRVEDRPRLLGVPFASADGRDALTAEVYIGSTPYSTAQGANDPLPIAPNSRATEELESLNAVVLPPLQPRAYAADDTASLIYEGSYAGDRSAGFVRSDAIGDRLEDATISFCAAGVYDIAAMTDYGASELGLDQADAEAFGAKHADYVQIISALLPDDDSYWRTFGVDRRECAQLFGPEDAESLAPQRDFRVLRARAGQLELESRDGSVTLAQARACFPAAIRYRLRTGKHWALVHTSTGFNHDIVASGPESACVRSCNPLKKWAKSRVFEISSTTCRAVDETGDPLDLRVGCAEVADPDQLDVACVYDQTAAGADGAVQIGGPAANCIFDGLTSRFAVYRGRAPSMRDAVFSWQTSGGFSPLVINLANVSTAVSPQSVQFVPQLERMAVVDGSSLGLSLIDFDVFGVAKPSPFF